MSKLAPQMFYIPALWHAGHGPLASLIMKVVAIPSCKFWELGRRPQVLSTKFMFSAAASRKLKSMGGILKALLFFFFLFV